ncbi:hypothetical protein [Arthrobacter methylotrophus]|uniref:hypothetical protein n=1 Tax=Arthrobacter methylotrophus TaxID=121291 RepID=UPI0031EBC0D4
MTVFLPRTKADRAQHGTTFKAPALSRLCPVAAFEAVIAGVRNDRRAGIPPDRPWGNVGDEALHAGSFVPLLRALFGAAELPRPTATAATRCGAASRPGPTRTSGISRSDGIRRLEGRALSHALHRRGRPIRAAPH